MRESSRGKKFTFSFCGIRNPLKPISHGACADHGGEAAEDTAGRLARTRGREMRCDDTIAPKSAVANSNETDLAGH